MKNRIMGSAAAAFLLTLCPLLSSLQAQEEAIRRVAIYATKMELVSPERIKELSGSEKIQITKGEKEDWTELEFAMGGATMTLVRRPTATKKDQTHLDGFQGYTFKELAGEKMDAHVFSVLRQIKKTNQIYVLSGQPALPTEGKTFVKKLANESHAMVFLGRDIHDSDLKVLLGPESHRDDAARLPEFDSAVKRKARSMEILKKRNLKPLPALPTITADEEVDLRKPADVARRAICLMAVAAHAEAGEEFDASDFLKTEKVWGALSPEEKKFVQSKKLTDDEKSTMTWRYEALWALLWSLGKVDEIGFPGRQSDAAEAISVIMKDPQKMISEAKLRPAAEILDQADLLYRCIWLVHYERKNNKEPEGLSGSVVYERLFALNWLIQYMRQPWDDTVVDS